jgi:hypothetical protein
MGKLYEFQEEVTNSALKQKLYDEWSERGTLEATTRRITLTLKEMGILKNEIKTRYTLHKINLVYDEIIDFVITQGIKLDGSSYYSYTELSNLYILFPFRYQVSKEMLAGNDKYVMTGFGGEVSFTLKE